jgi:hypothetical protein
MSDERGKELLRKAEAGDPDAGARAIAHGARSHDDNLVVQALGASVGSIDSATLDAILYIVGEELASREGDRMAGRVAYKAGELHMPKLGNVTLGRLIYEVISFLEKLESGDKDATKLMTRKVSYGGWYSRRSTTSTTSDQLKKATKVLESYDNIMVGSSSGLRIYAVKREDSEKARKKIEKKQRAIESKMANAKKALQHREQQLRRFELEKKQVEKKMAAQMAELKDEKARLEKQKGEL